MSDIVADIRNHLRTMAPHQLQRLTAKQLEQAANVIDSLRAEVRIQRQEIAALREERRALLGADAPPTWRNERADGGWIA